MRQPKPTIRQFGVSIVTIQFESVELAVLPVMIPTTLVEVELVSDVLNEDNEGWTLVTRQRPKKQKHIQPPPLHRRKR